MPRSRSRSKSRPVPDKVVNKSLWLKARREANARYKVHSAYKSGFIVQRYKELGGKFRGTKPQKKGLSRWYKEKWVNQRGQSGYENKSDIYRPSKKITNKTPTTWKEISTKEIKRARRVKSTKGRVKKFKRSRSRLRKTK